MPVEQAAGFWNVRTVEHDRFTMEIVRKDVTYDGSVVVEQDCNSLWDILRQSIEKLEKLPTGVKVGKCHRGWAITVDRGWATRSSDLTGAINRLPALSKLRIAIHQTETLSHLKL